MTMSQGAFLVLVAAVFAERALEPRISRRHLAGMLERGGRVRVPGRVGTAMLVLHLSWFVAMIVEVMAFDRPFHPWLAAACSAALAAGMTLRALSMRALGDRWAIQVATIPDEPLVEHGIYRYLRHPNYLGVIIEMPALPLWHGAWVTALVYGLLNVAFMAAKIALEERALAQDGGEAATRLARLPRLVPGIF
ncbi:isoprenylcysteine carboxylmethyltransferase family protein [Lentzea sp. NPDC051208]|uniref:isoprenylcysteine carboxylmethyltransferase family protein n=1 Tax=Lentzea sp. NPDC051208 TaxID=3154642 RepID=UPI003421DA77